MPRMHNSEPDIGSEGQFLPILANGISQEFASYLDLVKHQSLGSEAQIYAMSVAISTSSAEFDC